MRHVFSHASPVLAALLLAALLLAALLLAGCAAGPDFSSPAPPDASSYDYAPYAETTADGAQHIAPGEDIPAAWWELFHSEALNKLVAQAIKDNPNDPQAYTFFADLALRDRRVTEARLLFEKADSLMLKFTVAKRKKALEPQILAGLAMTSEAREDWAGAKQYILWQRSFLTGRFLAPGANPRAMSSSVCRSR